jgi:AraC-like DNA-binding protein
VDYREYAPRPALSAVVDRLWTLSGGDVSVGTDGQPVLPDGRPELIVHFGTPLAQVRTEGLVPQPRLVFAGQLHGPLTLVAAGPVDVLGVRFRTDGAGALVGAPQHQRTGVVEALDDVETALARTLDRVRERVSSAETAIEVVQDILERVVRPSRLDVRVREAVAVIRRRHGQIDVDRIADHVGMTRRHLERRFQELVGLSPKRLARIARFQHARRMLQTVDPTCRGTLTAAACGYADQAHLIRDFRELAGVSPETFLRQERGFTDLFVDDGR